MIATSISEGEARDGLLAAIFVYVDMLAVLSEVEEVLEFERKISLGGVWNNELARAHKRAAKGKRVLKLILAFTITCTDHTRTNFKVDLPNRALLLRLCLCLCLAWHVRAPSIM